MEATPPGTRKKKLSDTVKPVEPKLPPTKTVADPSRAAASETDANQESDVIEQKPMVTEPTKMNEPNGDGQPAINVTTKDAATDLKERREKIRSESLSFFYGSNQALFDVSLSIPEKCVTAFIGPSGCGKSTYLRCLNRMNELIEGTRLVGNVLLDGEDIYSPLTDVVELRKRVGMVFQKSNPFPKSIFENIAYGPRIAGNNDKAKLQEIVERCLKQSALWEEVKDRLHSSALQLSGGQQQRLCIARALATNPAVLLMDEPASALDPASTSRIEDLIFELKQQFTIVIVTHNMQQAARVSDQTAFFFQGRLVEVGVTNELFTNPSKKETEDYITGRFG